MPCVLRSHPVDVYEHGGHGKGLLLPRHPRQAPVRHIYALASLPELSKESPSKHCLLSVFIDAPGSFLMECHETNGECVLGFLQPKSLKK